MSAPTNTNGRHRWIGLAAGLTVALAVLAVVLDRVLALESRLLAQPGVTTDGDRARILLAAGTGRRTARDHGLRFAVSEHLAWSYDWFNVNFWFPNDFVLSYTGNQCSPGAPTEIACRVYGSKGMIDTDYYTQPALLFNLMDAGRQQVLFENTARALGSAPDEVQRRHIENCMKADPAYGKGVAKALGLAVRGPSR